MPNILKRKFEATNDTQQSAKKVKTQPPPALSLIHGVSLLEQKAWKAWIDLNLGSNNVDVNVTDADGNTALHYCAQIGDTQSIKRLLELRANKYARNNRNLFPGHLAALCQHKNAFKLVYDSTWPGDDRIHAESWLNTSDKQKLLTRFFQSDNGFWVACALSAGAKDTPIDSCLHRAIAMKNLRMIYWMVYSGTDIEMKDLFHQTPLNQAVSSIDTYLCSDDREVLKDIIEMLIEHGADLDAKDGYGLAPLHIACKILSEAGLDVARKLLKRGANPNIRDHNLATPMHYVARATNAWNNYFRSLIDSSSEKENNSRCLEAYRLLVEHGGDGSLRDACRQTPSINAGGNDLMRQFRLIEKNQAFRELQMVSDYFESNGTDCREALLHIATFLPSFKNVTRHKLNKALNQYSESKSAIRSKRVVLKPDESDHDDNDAVCSTKVFSRAHRNK